MTCCCDTIGAPDTPRQCPEHFGLWRGDKRLTSVSKIVGMWPQEPCSQCGMPIYSDHVPNCRVKAAFENARERGSEVDTLFGKYVMGKLTAIPAGVREDSRNLFMKLKLWFDKQKFSNVESQVLVADNEVGGVLDLRLDGMILDLKCTYDISPTAAIQVGGYAALDDASRAPEYRGKLKAGILHCSERFTEPKLKLFDVQQIMDDFATCRAMWKLVNRNGKYKGGSFAD